MRCGPNAVGVVSFSEFVPGLEWRRQRASAQVRTLAEGMNSPPTRLRRPRKVRCAKSASRNSTEASRPWRHTLLSSWYRGIEKPVDLAPMFPLGFHDTLHHMPVVRQAIVASESAELGELPWILLGAHSTRLDIGGRDSGSDEALGLNCAWCADIFLTLTESKGS